MKFISTLSALPFVLVKNKNMARGPPFLVMFCSLFFSSLFPTSSLRNDERVKNLHEKMKNNRIVFSTSTSFCHISSGRDMTGRCLKGQENQIINEIFKKLIELCSIEKSPLFFYNIICIIYYHIGMKGMLKS